MSDLINRQPDHTADIGKKVSISCTHENDQIYRKAAIEALARMMPRSYTPDGSHPADEEIFRAQEIFADCIEALEILPSAQPEKQHGRIFQEIIVVKYPSYNPYPERKGKPYFSIKYTENGQEFIGYSTYKPEVLSEYLKEYFMPSAQPEIIHCGECIYYDPPHVEKEDARYEYSEMPKEAFDVLGTGLVSMEYGINIGGRCCVDYYCKSYSDDKRVYVREDNYCGRAERRTDETD